MTSDAAQCEAIQVRLGLGEALSPEQTAHLSDCKDCTSALEISRALHQVLGAGPAWSNGERVLDQYEIVDTLGRGGQGAVYKARDLETGLIVALKVVAQGAHSVDEVLHAAGITHPNVCRINHTRSAGPFRVIVMEYVRGSADVSTLRDLLARGPVPTKEGLEIFRGICAGVRAAHGRDVLHLDLKPGNILLRDGKVPVVADFGLAAVSGSRLRGGTPGYMAPEQARSEAVDRRADVFALGIILSELVTNPGRRLKSVIDLATRTKTDERLSSVDDLLRLVDSSERSRTPIAIVGVVAVVVVLAAGLAWHSTRQTQSRVTSAAGVQPSATALIEIEGSTSDSTIHAANVPVDASAIAVVVDAGVAVDKSMRLNGVSPVPPVPAAATATITANTCHGSLIDDCKRQCDLDDAASCHKAGRYYFNNLGDAASAAAYYRRACNGRFMDGCVDLGMSYESGRGVKKDFGQAATLYRQACDAGSAHGCNNLGGLYGNGDGFAVDLVQATKLFTRACDGGDPDGCGNLGVAYRDGAGVAADKGRAIELLKRACRSDQVWCDDYDKAVKVN